MKHSKGFMSDYSDEEKILSQFLIAYRDVLHHYGAKITKMMLEELMDELKNDPSLY